MLIGETGDICYRLFDTGPCPPTPLMMVINGGGGVHRYLIFDFFSRGVASDI